jgi:hypothetical protein
MNKQLLRWVVSAFVFIAFVAVETTFAQNPVTFRVRMSIKMREGTFLPGSGDIVRVAGSFNNWGSSTDTLRDINAIDSVYEKTINLAAGNIEYKYLKTLRGGIDWEGGSNRTYTVTVGTQAVPLVWFDNDSVFTPAVNAPVVFQVNMRVKMLEGSFQPGAGDRVRVPGSFNGWNTNADTLTDPNNDSIYTKTIQILENTTIQYKFFKTPRGGSDWEGDPNRTYTVPVGGGTIPVVYFDRDSIVNTPVSGTFRWTVDMTAFLTSATGLGWFVPTSNDTMEVRGSFNGWGGSPRAVLQRDPLTTATYFTTTAFNQFSGDVVSFKYYIDMDSASAVTRFPNFNNDQDGHRYEHPFNRGDGNQQYTLSVGGNVSPSPGWFFSGINPRGVLDAVTDTVDITLRVNMGPAKRGTPPFVPATDTVKLVLFDPLSVSAQRRIQGTSFTNLVRATLATGGGDSIFQATYRIIGKAHYGIMYGWRFTKAGAAGEVTEGAGLGAQGGYRTKYVTPTTPNNFVRTYAGSQDTWQGTVVPLPQATPPYPTDVASDNNPIPAEFALNQNYPNPFNPTTTIKFTLAKQSFVTLKVYNLIGQEVETLINGLTPAGETAAVFDASKHATGVYFYRLQAGNFNETRKMLLLK